MAEARPEFWEEAEALTAAAPIAFLATAAGGQPHVRAVTPAYIDQEVYVAAGAGSAMVRQITGNPRVELLHWTRDFRHLRIVGRADLRSGADADPEAICERFPYELADFFGPDLNDMSLIIIRPCRISLTTLADIAADRPPRVWRAAD